MTEKFPNLVREKVMQVQEAQQVPKKITQRVVLQDTELKWQNAKKNNILKSSREK